MHSYKLETLSKLSTIYYDVIFSKTLISKATYITLYKTIRSVCSDEQRCIPLTELLNTDDISLLSETQALGIISFINSHPHRSLYAHH